MILVYKMGFYEAKVLDENYYDVVPRDPSIDNLL